MSKKRNANIIKVLTVIIPILLIIGYFYPDNSLNALYEYSEEVWNYRNSDQVNREFATEVLNQLGLNTIQEITDLSSIKELNLTSSNVKEIPYAINFMDNLEVLILDDNLISTIPTDVIDKITKLKTFSIKGNYLISLPNRLERTFPKESFYYNLLGEKEHQYTIDLSQLAVEVDDTLLQDVMYTDRVKKLFKEVHLLESPEDILYPMSKPIPDNFDIILKEYKPAIDLSMGDESYYHLMFAVESSSIIIEEPEIIQDPEINQETDQESEINQDELEINQDSDQDELEINQETDQESEINQEPDSNQEEDTGQDDLEIPTDSDHTQESELELEQEPVNITIDQPIPQSKIQEKSVIVERVVSQAPILLKIDNRTINDKPKIWAITPSYSDWTNKPVELEVDAQSYKPGGLLYSFNGSPFGTSNKYTVTESQTVEIKVKDSDNVTEVAEYVVDNIDTTRPLTPTVKLYRQSDLKPYNQVLNSKGWAKDVIILETTNRHEARLGDKHSPIDYMFIELETKTEEGKPLRIRETSLNQYQIKNLKDIVRVGYVDMAGNESLLSNPITIKVDTEPPEIVQYNIGPESDTWISYSHTAYLKLNAYKENLSDQVEYTLDGGKTWTFMNGQSKEFLFNQVTPVKLALRDEAGNVSEIKEHLIYADNTTPILTGFSIEPRGNTYKDSKGKVWTSDDVVVRPVGDVTNTPGRGNWWRLKLDGKMIDPWLIYGGAIVEENLTNVPLEATDGGLNWAKETVYVTFNNIDREPPVLQDIKFSNQSGTHTITVTATDAKAGLHPTESVVFTPTGVDIVKKTSNTLTYKPKTGGNARIDFYLQDGLKNRTASQTILIENHQYIGTSPQVLTDKVFNKWGKEDHTISIKQGFSPTGITSTQYRIRTIRNKDGAPVNTLSPTQNYTGSFKFSTEGEFEIEAITNTKSGKQIIGPKEKILLDKTPPAKPIISGYHITNQGKVPIQTYKDTGIIKFPVYDNTTNWATADKLSGVEARDLRIVNGKPVKAGGYRTEEVPMVLHNSGDGNNYYFIDRAGNVSPAAHRGSLGVSNKPKITRTTYSRDPGIIGDTPVTVEFTLLKLWYHGFHEYPVSELYSSYPKYDANFLNLEIDSEKFIKWNKSNMTPNSHGQREIEQRFTVNRNGTYYFLGRAREDLIGLCSFTVDNIDLEPPVIKDIKFSQDGYTKDEVILTIDATDDCRPEDLLYSFDGGITFSPDNTFTVRNNQEIKVAVKDSFNRVTVKPDPVVVDNIDYSPPVVTNMTQSIQGKQTLVNLKAEDIGKAGLHSEYIYYNNKWSSDNNLLLDWNSKTKIKLRDRIGNESDLIITVDEKGHAMISPVISGSVPSGQFTQDSVHLTIAGAVLPGKIERYLYSLDGGNMWSRYNPDQGLTINREGSHDLIAKAVDIHGNETIHSEVYKVRITRTIPIIEEVRYPTDWSNDIELEVIAKNIVGEISEYSFDGGVTWQESNKLKVKENNTTYTILARDKLKLTSEKKIVTINKYDPHPPKEPKVTITGTPFKVQELSITDIEDLPVETKNQSGIDKVLYQVGNNSPTEYTQGEIITIKDVTPNLKVSVKVYDKAGNVTEVVNILNQNILSAEVSISNEFVEVSPGRHVAKVKINNKGTPISTQLQIDDSNAIPLILDDLDWENLTIGQTKTKAQLTLPTVLYEIVPNKEEMSGKKFINGTNKFIELDNGVVDLDLELRTGTATRSTQSLDYKFQLIIDSKYK